MAITSYGTDDAIESRLAYNTLGRANTKRLRGADRTAAYLTGRNKYGRKTTGSQIAAGATWTGIGIAAGVAGYFTGGVAGAAIIGGAAAAAGGTSLWAHKRTEKSTRGTEEHKEIAKDSEGGQALKTGAYVGAVGAATYAATGAVAGAAGAGAAGSAATTSGAATGGAATGATTTTTATGSTGALTGSIAPAGSTAVTGATSASGTAVSGMGTGTSAVTGLSTTPTAVTSGAAASSKAAGATTMQVSSAGTQLGASSQAPAVVAKNSGVWASKGGQAWNYHDGATMTAEQGKAATKAMRVDKWNKAINKAMDIYDKPTTLLEGKVNPETLSTIQRLGGDKLIKTGVTKLVQTGFGAGQNKADEAKAAAQSAQNAPKDAMADEDSTRELKVVAEKPVRNEDYYKTLARKQQVNYVDFDNMSEEEFEDYQRKQMANYYA